MQQCFKNLYFIWRIHLLLLLLSRFSRVRLCATPWWKPTRLPRPWDSPGKNTGVGCHFLLKCVKVKSESEVAQSCPTLSDPMDCSLPGSFVHGIFQAGVLEWVAIAFSRRIHLNILKSCLIYWFINTEDLLRKVRYKFSHCCISILILILEKEMATHSSVLAWTEKPGRLQSMGSHRVGHDWSNLAATDINSGYGKSKFF